MRRLPLFGRFCCLFGLAAQPLGIEATEPINPAPLNDSFVAAIPLVGISVAASGTTLGATSESGEPILPGNTARQTVWWTWTAPANGLLKLSVVEENYSTALAVFSGETIGSLELLAHNQSDWGITCFGPETRMRDQVTFTVTAGQSYHLAADWNAYQRVGLVPVVAIDPPYCLECPPPVAPPAPPPVGGLVSFQLEFTAAPPNDAWATATAITGGRAELVGDTLGANTEAGEPKGLFHTIWWRWTAPRSGWLAFGTNLPPVRPAPSSTTLKARLPAPPYNDPRGWPADKVIPIGVPHGSGTDGNSSGVINISVGSVIDTWNGGGIGFIHCGDATELNPPPPFEPAVRLFRGASLDQLTQLAGGLVSGTYQVRVQAGETYYLTLGSLTPAMGVAGFQMELTAPENDDFADRVPIVGVSAWATGHNVGAQREVSEPEIIAPGATGHSVWWTWTAPDDGLAAWTVASTNFSPVLTAYRGDSLLNLAVVTTTDPGGNVVQRVTQGETWQLAVDGTSGHEEGDYTLMLNLEPLAPELDSPPQSLFDGSWVFQVNHLRGRGMVIYASIDLRAWSPIWAGIVNANAAAFRDYTGPAGEARYYVVRLAEAGQESWFIQPPPDAAREPPEESRHRALNSNANFRGHEPLEP